MSSKKGAQCFIDKNAGDIKISGSGQSLFVDWRSVIIKNECLNLKQYFLYRYWDNFQAHDRCTVIRREIGDAYRISCSTWVPEGKEQLPDRIVPAGA